LIIHGDPPPARLLLDLAGVEFMDSIGLAVLLTARQRATDAGCRFLVSSTSPAIAKLFEMTGLTGVLMQAE
jgi:anti-anti-sigma factor